MKIAVHLQTFRILLVLVLVLEFSGVPAQDYKGSQKPQVKESQALRELNKTILTDKEKQAELLRFNEENSNSTLQRDDTLALYLADMDALIDISQKQNVPYPIKVRDDCRSSIKNDLQQLTLNGVRSGLPFREIAAINDAYLNDIFNQYKARNRKALYGKKVPEFGQADYLKAIKNIFTTIVTLKVNSLTEDVKVVVYSMRDNQFVANGTGRTEFVQPLESGSYIVELSKPGYKKKLKKVVLGKYPKTITINEPLVML
jgi:hypothetical protein